MSYRSGHGYRVAGGHRVAGAHRAAGARYGVRLFVIAGQSNAKGRGDTDNVTIEPGLATPYPAVQESTHTANGFTDPIVWSDTGPRDLQPRTAGGEFGVELSMFRRLTEGGMRSACAKIAVDSTSLDVHWDPTAGAPAPDNLFEQMIAYVAASQAALGASIAGLVWIQGEGDAANEARSLAYEANLTAFMAAFRTSYPDVPLYFNRLHVACVQAFTANVRAQQEAYALADPLSTLIDVDDLVLIADGLHFDSDSLVTFGNRIAAEVLA